jgi:hypothetical protein
MRLTTPLIACMFTAACGSRSPAPAPATSSPPANVGTAPAPVTTAPASAAVDVRARCAELRRPSNEARDAARILATSTTWVAEAVTCLADALDRTRGPSIGGTEQKIEQDELRRTLAGAIYTLSGIGGGPYDLDQDASLHALADQARDWARHH